MSKTQDFACGFHDNESITNEKLIYPAASRNKESILQVLKRFLITDTENDDEENPLFVEIASGSGQHVAHFAPHFPNFKFQPTEVDSALLGSISYYAKHCPTKNILPPLHLDICNSLSQYGFKEESIDYIYNANMIHITPFECTIRLFENAGQYLKRDAFMITYGPYAKDGRLSPDSNIRFDATLRDIDPSYGVRDINDLTKLGEKNNLSLIDTIEMPSNNKTLIWKKN
ncbi:hypothetical protein O3G_MSEX001295 [Manduca sexta]|uniref:Methyltransferase-like 26 n=1 Tax=Manduca sexta TaxID=7130 RepID=A0A922C953_MANSE|nr:hypothetical protein O3G_MSEX001295 [Manduca sexta]